MADDQHPGPYKAGALLVTACVSAALINIAFGLSQIDPSRRELIDTDGYMRYARILDLVQGRNGWFDGWIHWSNAPYGHSMHWTRPLDALVVALGAPLAPFIGWHDAVYWSGIATGPGLHIAVVLAVAWAARPLMPAAAAALAGLVAAVQPVVVNYAGLGRLDHHVLITALAAVLVGTTLRVIMGDEHRAALATGAVAAAALWVSTESLLPVGLAVGTLLAVWIVTGRGIAGLHRTTTALAVGVAVACLLELGPGDLGAIEYDRISLPYLVATTLAAVSIAVVAVAARSDRRAASWQTRSLLTAAATVPAVVLIVWWFPGFLGGPFVDVPDRVREIWLDNVSESQPIWSNSAPVSITLLRLGAPVVAVLLAVVVARRRGQPDATAWWTVAAWLAATTLLGLSSTRFALYPEMLAGIPLAAVCWAAIRRWGRHPGLRGTLVRPSLVLVTVLGYWLLPLVTIRFDGGGDEQQGELQCETATVAERLRPLATVVLANLDLGPELHVRSGLGVIATPHHRNVDGILDSYDLMRAPLDEARSGIEQRGIDAVVICPAADTPYLSPVPPDSLYAALLAGRPPAWLREVPSGTPESQVFLLTPG